MNLRPYQRTAIDAIRERWDAGDPNALLVLATGLGKTVVFCTLGRELRMEGIGKTLVLAHRKELLDQAREKWLAVEPDAHVGIYQGARREFYADVICASVQSCYPDVVDGSGNVTRRGRINDLPLKDIGLVIVDECHHLAADTYRGLLTALREHNPNAVMLGVTATPYRNDGKGLGEFYDRVAFRMGIGEGIEQGFLAALRGCRVELDIDLSQVKTSKRTGDFVESDLGNVMDTEQARREIERAWQREMGPGTEAGGRDGRFTAAFTPTVESAQHLCQEFEDAGVSAVWVSGSMPKADRIRSLDAYQKGESRVIVNCLDTATEILTQRGWIGHEEFREDDAVATLNPTTELMEWQPVSRVVRRKRAPNERMVRIKNQSIDIRVTEGHRMMVRAPGALRWSFREAGALVSCGGPYQIPVSGVFAEDFPGVPLFDEELEFLGLFATDGHLNKPRASIEIAQKHGPFCAEIERILSACGFDWKVSDRAGRYNIYRIPKGNIGGALARRGWSRLESWLDKSLSPKLADCTRSQFARLLYGLWLGDGTKSINRKKPAMNICGIDWEMNRKLQEWAPVRGWTTTYRVVKNTAGGRSPNSTLGVLRFRERTVISTNNHTSPTSGGNPASFESEWSDEDVWCVTNANGTIFTRRGGRIAVMGQCAVLTEGWDAPHTSCVLIARPTQSIGMYAQMVGRGTRLYQGKADCVVMDCVGASRLGLASLADLSTGAESRAPGIDPEEETEDEVVVDKDAKQLEIPELAQTIQVRGCTVYDIDLFGGQVVWTRIRGMRLAILDIGLHIVLYQEPNGGAFTAMLVDETAAIPFCKNRPERECLAEAEQMAMVRGRAKYLKPNKFQARMPATEKQMLNIQRLTSQNVALGGFDGRDVPQQMSMPQAMAWIAYLKTRRMWMRTRAAAQATAA